MSNNPTSLFPRKLVGLSGMSWLAEVELNHLVHLGSFKSSMLEIGTASGASAGYISRNCPHLKMVCVDNFGGSAEYDAERLQNWKANATPRMSLVNVDAKDLRKELPPRQYNFDLILVDGDHSYEGCLRDLALILPYCITGKTTVVCHDYGDPNHRGVQLAVHEFMYRFPSFRFVNIQHSLIEMFYEEV